MHNSWERIIINVNPENCCLSYSYLVLVDSDDVLCVLTEIELPPAVAAVLYFPFPLLPLPFPWPGGWWGGWWWWTPLDLYFWVWRGVPGTCGIILVILPTALVLPSRNTMRVLGWINSGFLMKRKRHVALSPVRRWSLSIEMIEAVCLVLPQWTAKK